MPPIRAARARFAAGAPIAQLGEAADLKSVQCRFESDWGHDISPARTQFSKVRNVMPSGRQRPRVWSTFDARR
jgi:hypothetical protein